MGKKIILIFLVNINCLTIFSCNMINPIALPGKISVTPLNSGTCRIYMNSDWPKFKLKLKNEKDLEYSGLTWLNREDNFLGSEIIRGKSIDENQVNIAKFDLSGKLIDRIYEARKGEQAWVEYPSRDDKYLLFITDPALVLREMPADGTEPMVSLHIMDFEQKKVIKRLDSIGRSGGFSLNESPWLFKEYRFIYSILQIPRINSEGKTVNTVEKDSVGIYIYDMSTGEHKMLVPNGDFAIASPVSNQIAYRKERSIKVLDLNTNEEKTVYKIGKRENVLNIHWTPDGKYIYLARIVPDYLQISDVFNSYGEKLIDVSGGGEIAFKKIGHGFDHYTWK